MKSLLRRRPSPAMLVALVALFVSLSGVSYGVATGFIDSREIKNNEVRSIDIRNNEIRTRDLRNNEVRGIDIRNSTVQGRDIALNTVTGEDVKEDTLQKVPSAMLADSATTVELRRRRVKMQRFAYSRRRGLREADRPYRSVGLTITAECRSGPAMDLVATRPAANQPNSHISSTGSDVEDVDFDPGDDVTGPRFTARGAQGGHDRASPARDGSIVTGERRRDRAPQRHPRHDKRLRILRHCRRRARPRRRPAGSSGAA